MQESGFSPRVRKIPWRWKWQATPVFSSGKSHGQTIVHGVTRARHNLATKPPTTTTTVLHDL